MERLTPLVQPLSIDEAVLDLAGTAALHGAPPAAVLARFAREVEREVGVTVSIGLARQPAAGQDRRRARQAARLRRDRRARRRRCWRPSRCGCCPASVRHRSGGSRHSGSPGSAICRRSTRGRRARLLGEDGAGLVAARPRRGCAAVDPGRETKSVSAETTFATDLSRIDALERHLWRLSETAGAAAEGKELAAGGVVLKLKTRRLRAAHPRRPPPGPDRAAGPAVRGRAHAAGAGGGWHGVPPDRHRRPAAATLVRPLTGLTSPTPISAAASPGRRRSTLCAGASGPRR